MIHTLDELRTLLAALPGPDADARKAAIKRDSELTKPPGSLARLEDIAVWVAEWQGGWPPRAADIRVVVFAGNHGVTAQGVSAFPAEVTAQMVANFATGGAAINKICDAVGAGLEVHPLALDRPTADFTQAPAMSPAECTEAFAFGMDKVPDDCDLLCLGEMGIGNTTAAATICCALFGGDGAGWVGPGTGVDDEGLRCKIQAVDDAMAFHGAALDDPLEVMARVGGRELAAIAGAVVAARQKRIPVILDGFVACAAAAPLIKANAAALDHCLAGHLSAEPGHEKLLREIGKAPLLDLGMRLGEASGAALAAAIVRAAVATHTGMASFAEAGVSTQDE